MLSYGGVQFASTIFLAFLSFYPLVLLTDVALIPPAIAGILLSGLRLFSAVGDQAIGIYINRVDLKGGKYRPWIRVCALPHSICLIAVGLTPGFNLMGKIIYAALALALCELFRSLFNIAATSMLPYMADADEERVKYISFSTAFSIIAYLLISTFMLPLVNFLGKLGAGLGGWDNQRIGFALAFVLFAIIAAPLCYNAYYRLSEGSYNKSMDKQPILQLYAVIIKNKRLILFFISYCLYSAADAFRSLTTYHYVLYNLGHPEFITFIIMAGILSPLAMQLVIPRLLLFAKKETLIIASLFVASALSLIFSIFFNGPYELIVLAVLYGIFTAVMANLAYAMVASFADEMRERHNIQMSDVLSATLSLSYKVGAAIAGGAAPIIMAIYGYSAGNAQQPAAVLASIKMIYFTFSASGLALAAIAMLFVRVGSKRTAPVPNNPL